MTEKAKKTENKSVATSENAAPQFETFVIHSVKYETLLTKKFKNRKKWEPKNEKHVISFIPGTILKILVKDKEKVQKDQPILVLEAMKMENTIFAPSAITIKKVYVKEGDRVPKGQLLIEFE
jgi:biotin carboxyl carrier protein